MTSGVVTNVLPEWPPFLEAVEQRPFQAGTWCEAWTVRDVVVHQAGNAEELARVLAGHVAGEALETRRFEEREAPYRSLSDRDLLAALGQGVERLAEISEQARAELGSDRRVAWTGRTMEVGCFPEHMREELVLHRWDITGDDDESTSALAEPWMTTHTVRAVGRPLLARGAGELDLGDGDRFSARLRVPGVDDVVVTATSDTTTIELAPPDGPATIEADAATRVLMLWGRRPADPARWRSSAGPVALGRLRTLLGGY
jgi:hypothetical protein